MQDSERKIKSYLHILIQNDPFWEDLDHKYDITSEPILEQSYWNQTRISKIQKRMKYRNSSIK